MKYKVQHLGRNNLQYENSKGTAAHKQVSKKRSGSYKGKWGKDLMLIFICCTRVGDIIAENKENDKSIEKMILDKRLKEIGLLFKLQQRYRRKMPSRFLSEVEKRKYLHSL